MNWFALGGLLLHVLKNAPELVEQVEQLYDAVRGLHKAPIPVWQAVSDKIAEVKGEPSETGRPVGQGGTATGG